MNVYVSIVGRKKVAGLCGTPDGDPTNEWKDRNTGYYWAITSIYVPVQIADSWRCVLMRARRMNYCNKHEQTLMTLTHRLSACKENTQVRK